MSVDSRKRDAWQAMQQENAARYGQSLNTTGGGGTFDGMEARVAKLEADVSHLVKQADRIDARLATAGDDIAAAKTDIAVIKATMASKGYIDARLLVMLGVIAALIAFGEKLQALIS